MWVSIFLPPLRRAGCRRRGRRRHRRRPGRRRERAAAGQRPPLPAFRPGRRSSSRRVRAALPSCRPSRPRAAARASHPGRGGRRVRARAPPPPRALLRAPARPGPGARAADGFLLPLSAVRGSNCPAPGRSHSAAARGDSETAARRSSPAWAARVRLTPAGSGTRRAHRRNRARALGVGQPRCALRVLRAGSPAQWYAPAPPELAEPFPWKPGSALGRGCLTPSAPGWPAASPRRAALKSSRCPTGCSLGVHAHCTPSPARILHPLLPAYSIPSCPHYFSERL